MRKHESYFEIPYEDERITDDRITDFVTDHIAKLEANNADHVFDTVIAETMAVFTQFNSKKVSKSETRAEQAASTITVDEYQKQYVELVRRTVGRVSSTYLKGTAVYKEFFPKPLTYYTNPRRPLIGEQIDHFITRLVAHPELGHDLHDAFTALKVSFGEARHAQESHKGSVKALIVGASEERKALNLQLFDNLLTIAKRYKGKPEYLKVFFDPSKLLHRAMAHQDDETNEFTVVLAPGETKNTGLTGIVGKKARFVNLSEVAVKVYTVASLDNLEPDARAITLDADGDMEYDIASLGAPANPYLILRNLGSEEAEVVIDWVE